MTTEPEGVSAHERPVMRWPQRVATVVIAVLVCACDKPQNTTEPDQCMRAEIFKACLQLLPAGPQATKYNDWDEVVKACESAAYYQSLRNIKAIKPECTL